MHPPIPRQVILILTAKAFGVDVDAILSSSRAYPYTAARWAAACLLREFRPELSVSEISRAMHKNHSSILHGLGRAKRMAEYDGWFAPRLETARLSITQWRPGEALAARSAPTLGHIAKTHETPSAGEIEPRRPSLHGSPSEYEAWFRASCKQSEERFLRIASAIHPERVR